jgi:hypothetical protein
MQDELNLVVGGAQVDLLKGLSAEDRAKVAAIDWKAVFAKWMPIILQILPLILAVLEPAPAPTPAPTPTPPINS